MATKGLSLDKDSFSCSICLDLLQEPVTIPCGHSYCMICISAHWKEEKGKLSYSCPQCRHRFIQRPVLVKNTLLALLMEGLKMSETPATPSCPSAPHGDVSCDLCSGRKAVKSCLQCLVSYCEEHLQPHYDVPALKKHKLMEPTVNLQENLCPQHDEIMKMFCRTDQQCICYLCAVDQHKGHQTVTAVAERAEKQRELQALQQNILHTIDLKQEEALSLQHQLKNNSASADAAVELSDTSLKELLAFLHERMNEVKLWVRGQQEAEEHRVRELQDQVQQKVSELQENLTDLDTLSRTEDHVLFLRMFVKLSKVSYTSASENLSQSPPPFHLMVTAAVSELRRMLQEARLMETPQTKDSSHSEALLAQASATQVSATAQASAPSKASAPTQASATQASAPAQASAPSKASAPAQASATQASAPAQASEDTLWTPPPPQNCTWDEWVDYVLKHKHMLLLGLPRPQSCLGPPPRPPPPSLQDTEEFPPLPLRNVETPASISDMTVNNFLKVKEHVRKISWDSRSLNGRLRLFEENLSVKRTPCRQKYKPHPFRFTALPQVVSQENLTGRCYFEVSMKFDKVCTVAVALKDIRRDGASAECSFGMNSKSWALQCFPDRTVVWHNGNKVEYSYGSHHLGVFVDHSAGVLTFYRRYFGLEEVHTFRSSFAQPLVAGLRLDDIGSSVELDRSIFNDSRDY